MSIARLPYPCRLVLALFAYLPGHARVCLANVAHILASSDKVGLA